MPSFIRQAIKLSHTFDTHFVTIESLEKYFVKYSYDKIDKDIVLFRQVGFVQIPNILELINSNVNLVSTSSKSKKEHICYKVIKQFKSNIEQAMFLEPFKQTIDNLLNNHE